MEMVLCHTSKETYKYGDKKYKHKFAWLPVKLDDGKIIWLEHYWEEWEYTEVWYDMCPTLDWWRTKRVKFIAKIM